MKHFIYEIAFTKIYFERNFAKFNNIVCIFRDLQNLDFLVTI